MIRSVKTKLSSHRLVAYVLGLLILTLGIAASVKSDLGCSPVASIPYTMTVLTGLEMGRATIVWQSVLVLAQFLILRRDFSPWTLLQLLATSLPFPTGCFPSCRTHKVCCRG